MTSFASPCCFTSRSTLSPSLSLLHVARIIEFPVISRRNTLYLLYRASSTLPPGLDVDEEIRNIREAATNRALHSLMSWPNQRHAISLRSLSLSLARERISCVQIHRASLESICLLRLVILVRMKSGIIFLEMFQLGKERSERCCI